MEVIWNLVPHHKWSVEKPFLTNNNDGDKPRRYAITL